MNLGRDGRDGRGGGDLSALGEGQYVMMLHSLITQFVQWCSQPLSHQIFPRPLLHFCLQLITRPPSQRWPLCWRWGQRRQSYSPLLLSGYSVQCREPIHKAGVRP